ncbi:MAG: hypothetical protein KME60_31260 [Cyanomargarita calcarea GSE-NOS-MK-12-04C]|jgi:hypothetical protein|uniref:Uncharacterized protein n=1 Tax=Cyanomargarita calcarea GSE-NOS-MK-12-04C TaxID=2839659 RepID=A0A951QWC5_9CYAN|nr:hypothetical protein [Cyanomargarita calcarea GSE-NOS-MK-12-04C]
MSPRHYPPAYLRYLKARLWNLARPGFWGTAIFLSVVGLGIREYWLNPDFFTQAQPKKQVASQQQPTDPNLSAEDKAIAADIDNLPVLYNDLEESVPASTTTSVENTEAKKNENSFEELVRKNKAAISEAKANPNAGYTAPPSKLENPFLVQSEKLLQLRNFESEGNFLGINSVNASSTQLSTVETSSGNSLGLFNRNNYLNQNNPRVNALQTALDQSKQQNQSTLNNKITPISSLMQTSYGEATLMQGTNSVYNQPLDANTTLNTNTINSVSNPIGYTQSTLNNLPPSYNNFNNTETSGTNLSPNSYSTFNNTQVAPTVGIPTPGISPVNSNIMSNTAPSYIQTPNQGAATNNISVGNVNYGNTGLQPTQTIQPNASIPRPTPGAYGGFQINGVTYP